MEPHQRVHALLELVRVPRLASKLLNDKHDSSKPVQRHVGIVQMREKLFIMRGIIVVVVLNRGRGRRMQQKRTH